MGCFDAKLEHEAFKVVDQPAFHVAFVGVVAQPQEIKVVGVFQGLLRQVG
jgi:hypothetical protein